MELKTLIKSANAANAAIKIKLENGKYSMLAEFQSEFIPCTTRTGDIRFWSSLDTLVLQLNKALFNGKIYMHITQQQQLIA